MCALNPTGIARADLAYVAAYSYGINSRDEWGEAVSHATGIPVHQYDCTWSRRPTCKPPCSFVFHDECLMTRQYPRNASRLKTNTLAGHLRENGHQHVAEGSLLLKVDIDGWEWAVFSEAAVSDLQKFRQLVMEVHSVYLGGFVDQETLGARISTMKRLLEVFVLVHIHATNMCHPIGTCLEMTFINRAFANASDCRMPARHPLDADGWEDVTGRRSEPNVADIFGPLFAEHGVSVK